MARKVETIVHIVDDFDDKPIDDGLAETIDFTWEGTSYTIDLRPTNADKFRKDVEKWVAAATKVTGRRGRPKGSGSGGARPGTGSGRSSEELANIREWAEKNGYEVSPRGRIKSEILDAYDEAHKS
ncbi:histone-like nucleoid-structuring protein Lsr2 [Mycolicibacterium sp. S3B2]|uniref:histone-like nucleoid-structuring protein Lsr2 n=1 Tax=Mycolicibacterium sp. S3B2 TaxID=3415120 RepID=UPI003C7EA789